MHLALQDVLLRMVILRRSFLCNSFQDAFICIYIFIYLVIIIIIFCRQYNSYFGYNRASLTFQVGLPLPPSPSPSFSLSLSLSLLLPLPLPLPQTASYPGKSFNFTSIPSKEVRAKEGKTEEGLKEEILLQVLRYDFQVIHISYCIHFSFPFH